MVIRSYWTPDYFKRKIGVILYEKTNPADPWLAKDANLYLQKKLNKTFKVLEIGSGRSTTWFAHRVGKLISIEHDPSWHSLVLDNLCKHQLRNFDLKLVERSNYVAEARELPKDFDAILVDGIFRDLCALEALKHLKSGGMLIIDDSQRYLPYGSKTPETIGLGPLPSNEWNIFHQQTKNWKTRYFSNGVQDTAILIKP